MKNILLISIFLLFLASCGEEKKDAVKSQSPDGTITLTISGSRETALSAWRTDLEAAGTGLKGKITFDFYGKDLNNETIQFEWAGNEQCTITFIQRDDTKRVFVFTPGSGAGMWKDLTEK